MKKFRHRIAISVTVIAVLAIVWNLLEDMNYLNKWWALPLTAAITGILAIIIPFLGKKFSILYSINAVGFTLLLMAIMRSFFTINILSVWEAIIVIAVITEFTQKTFHIGAGLFDLFISFVSAYLINNYGSSSMVITVIILLITYLMVILIDFDFQFSVKGANNETDISTDSNNVDVE